MCRVTCKIVVELASKKGKEMIDLQYFGHDEIPMPLHAGEGTNATCPGCGNLPALKVAGQMVPGYIVVGSRAFGICGCRKEQG